MIERIIASLLILAVLFCFASCKKNTEEDPSSGDGLVIEVENLEYSEEDVNNSIVEITELFIAFARVLGYSEQMINDYKEQIGSRFTDDVLPILLDVKVYPQELKSIIECLDEFVALIEGASGEVNVVEASLQLYSDFSAVLEAERLGVLVYEIAISEIMRKAESAQEKYDKHGYAFYLEDVKYYTGLVESAREIDRADFSDAISILAFTASAIDGSMSFDDGGVSISVADSVEIIERQGEKFASLELGGEDWRTVVKMCEAFLPMSFSSSLDGMVTLELADEGFFTETATVMPELIDFYALVCSDISEESVSLIEEDSEYAYQRAVCIELLKNEHELKALLSAIEQKLPAAKEDSVALASEYDGYLAFCEKYSADSEGLILAMRAFLENPDEATYGAVQDAYLGFFAEINSVAAYVYLYI